MRCLLSPSLDACGTHFTRHHHAICTLPDATTVPSSTALYTRWVHNKHRLLHALTRVHAGTTSWAVRRKWQLCSHLQRRICCKPSVHTSWAHRRRHNHYLHHRRHQWQSLQAQLLEQVRDGASWWYQSTAIRAWRSCKRYNHSRSNQAMR